MGFSFQKVIIIRVVFSFYQCLLSLEFRQSIRGRTAVMNSTMSHLERCADGAACSTLIVVSLGPSLAVTTLSCTLGLCCSSEFSFPSLPRAIPLKQRRHHDASVVDKLLDVEHWCPLESGAICPHECLDALLWGVVALVKRSIASVKSVTFLTGSFVQVLWKLTHPASASRPSAGLPK